MTITVNDSVNMFYNTLYPVGYAIGAGVLALAISKVTIVAMPKFEQTPARCMTTFAATVLTGLYCVSHTTLTPFESSVVIHAITKAIFNGFLLPGAIFGFLGPYALLIPIVASAAFVSVFIQK